MASRVPNRVRSSVIAAIVATLTATVLVTAIGPSIASATPTTSPNSAISVGNHIASVQQRLQRLQRLNDQLVERYDQAGIALGKSRAAAASARHAADAAQVRLASAEQQYSATAASQYESGSYSTTGALLSSSSGSDYLDQLDTMTMLSAHTEQIVLNVAAMQRAAAIAKQNAAKAYAAAGRLQAALAKQKLETKNQIAKYTTLLNSLNAQQRAIWAQQSGNSSIDNQNAVDGMRPAIRSAFLSGFSSPAQDSAILRRVVSFAINQVGKPYVWGSAGPDSYDCSGLTMASYAQGGISLPHSAAEQYTYGHHVSFNQMQPGDLMFYYSPIGHVAMYIGGGMMVTAPETGENVQIASDRSNFGSFVGATRLVG